MKFLDLFADIGGFRLGLESAGHECVGYVEWDKFARLSYQAIHNTEGEYTEHDIRAVKSSELPRADIWTFGFPCQDISVAGKMGGFTSGKRSSLFFTVTGLIRELKEEDKPSFLIIENVKNLLSINQGWDFAKLQIELDEIGYDCEWDVLDSAEVVPQHRERVYIVGHLRGRGTRKVFPITGENGTVTETVKKIGNVNPSGNGINGAVVSDRGLARTVTTNKGEGQKIAVNQLGNISDSDSFGGNPQAGRVYDANGISPTLNTMQGGGREPKILQRARGNNKGGEHEIAPTITSNSYQDNNSVVLPVLTPDRINKQQNGRRFKNDGEPEFTLTTQDKHGVAIPIDKVIGSTQKHASITDGETTPTLTSSMGEGGGHIPMPVFGNMRIRKLTPKECWRLQGFPDWAFEKAEQVNSNSQLYKQAGNSVTVSVVAAVASRLGFENKETYL